MARRDVQPVPTIGELLQPAPHWLWVLCNNRSCMRRSAIPLAPFVIRYGADASSDVLRRNFTCSGCGRRGASLQVPSWEIQTGEPRDYKYPG
jgi:hypothetical protein